MMSPTTSQESTVDRTSRKRIVYSRSPSPSVSLGSTSRPNRRSRSRSPYQEARGAKRRHEDDHYRHQDRRDRHKTSSKHNSRADGDRRNDRHRDRERYVGRASDPSSRSAGRSRSRSPPLFRKNEGQLNGDPMGKHEGRSKQQSVSDLGKTHVATAHTRDDAETNIKNDSQVDSLAVTSNIIGSTSTSIRGHHSAVQDEADGQPVDEAVLIAERRKRREAILARVRKQNADAMPDLGDESGPSSSQVMTPQTMSSPGSPSAAISADVSSKMAASDVSEVPNLLTKALLTKTQKGLESAENTEEPSAADYDPSMDMEEDKLRHGNRIRLDAATSDGIQPDGRESQADATTSSLTRNTNTDEDMFTTATAEDADDDMFALEPIKDKTHTNHANNVKPTTRATTLDTNMLDDRDDHEGYYKIIIGEVLDNRYKVLSNLGKGMFSGVVRAVDQQRKDGQHVAIKIIRNNEALRKAAEKEIEILEKLAHADPENKKHVVRLERVFEHSKHLCMVFENLNENLREVLKKFGRDVGINMEGIKAYARQMFLALSLLRRCNILHADLKPDNILANEGYNIIKVCDLGSAADITEGEITPYLVSRFYRAPEIILGIKPDFAIDMWSIGCTLYELYTGKILFTGRSNNQMLRAIMECRGRFNQKLLRKAEFAPLHFDDNLNFLSIEKDKITGKDILRTYPMLKPVRDLRARIMATAKGLAESEVKELNLFLDLLDKCLNLNPEKRCTPMEALKHPFIQRSRS